GLVKEVETLKSEKRYAEVNTRLDKLVADKKILPAQKAGLFTLLTAIPETEAKTYKLKVGSEGKDEKEFKSLDEVLMHVMETGSYALDTRTHSKSGAGEPDADMDSKAKAYM